MKTLRYAMKQIIPLVFSYLFVGLASGILLSQAGYSPVWAFLSAALIYAGSMQIVMVSLLTADTPLYMVAVMTLFINARHIFYGISFLDEFRRIGKQRRSFWKYPYMALTMTDETYSVLCSLKCPPDLDRQKVEFDILFLSHMFWIVGCSLGALIRDALPVDLAGIDFSATAFFAAVVVNQWRTYNSHIPAVVGFASAVLFYVLAGPVNFLLPALSASMIALILLKGQIRAGSLEGGHE